MNKNEKSRKNTLLKEVKSSWFYWMLALPGIAVLIAFSYIPMAGIYLAFENYSFKGGIFGSEFVGLKNFEFFFKNIATAIRATRNTITINLGGIFVGIIINVTVAIILNEIINEKFKRLAQAVMLLPHFLSWIVVGALSEAFLDTDGGIINQIICFCGGDPVSFYSSPGYWWGIMTFAIVWKGFGYGSVFYYSALLGIDPALYEAASIDGASRWRKIWNITLPLLKPTIIIMFLLNLGGILGGSIDMMAGMTKLNPLLLETTDTINTFLYRATIQNSQFGMSAAVSLYQSVFTCILVLGANLLAKKVDPDYALF